MRINEGEWHSVTFIKSALVILITLWLFSLLRTAVAEPANKSFTVGFIGSFSGPAQIYGHASKNGLELARLGMKQPRFSVIYEDDGFESKRTVSAFKKLVDIDGVDVVVTIGSTPSNAVAPLAEVKKIPLLAWASDERVTQGRAYALRLYPSGYTEGSHVAAEARRRGSSRIALISSFNDYAHSWRTGVRETLSKGELAMEEEVQPDVQDFRSLLLKAKQKKVDAFLICLNPGQNGLFAKQRATLGLSSVQLGGCEYLHDKSENEAAGGTLEGAWFVTVHISTPFRAEYVAAHGNDDVLSGAACLHDAALLLQQSLEAAGPKPSNIIEALKQVGRIRGALGDVSVTERDGDRYIDMPLEVRRVVKTGSEFVRRISNSRG